MQIIEQRDVLGKDFKVYGDCENPLFLAKDVAEWIEHNKPSEMLQGIDDAEKLKAIISHSGQNREMWFLSEDGLYEVLMQSRKPIAKEFKKQVKQILRDIRKHGLYATDQLLDNPDLMIAAMEELKKERAKTKILEQENQLLLPKAKNYDIVIESDGTLSMGEFAKSIKWRPENRLGSHKLYQLLRNNQIIQQNGREPYERFVREGYFIVTEYRDWRGNITTSARVTPKGINYLLSKFRDWNLLDEAVA